MRRGHYVLQVDAADQDEAVRAQDVINRFNQIDIDEKSTEWRESGWTPRRSAGDTRGLAAAGAAESSGEATIPLAEERLEVGKREVQTGGVRVISRVVQKPVEADVSLREERATVTRRPVDRAVTDADQAFQEQSIEVRETAEEVDTAAFRKWFGSSVVVDEAGAPLRVYHGTRSGEFDEFRVSRPSPSS